MLFCDLAVAKQTRVAHFYEQTPLAQDGPELISFLARRGLTRGFAPYSVAHPLTWKSESAVRAHPIHVCQPSNLACPFPPANVSTWYRPRAVPRSFIIVGPSAPPLADPQPAQFGHSTEVSRVGRYTVFLYDYDVASRLAPP